MGLPDLFCCHRSYGARWVEVKRPVGYSFTPAQVELFPKLIAHGVGVWIINDASETEYKKLFGPSNFWTYLM
jgi:hypothetical protein